MGLRWDGDERRHNFTTRRRVTRKILSALAVGWLLGFLGGVSTGFILDRGDGDKVRYECTVDGEEWKDCTIVPRGGEDG